jgi:hypothetical protein
LEVTLKIAFLMLLALLVSGCSAGTVLHRPPEEPSPDTAERPWSRGRLVTTTDGHYFVHTDGTPFFWLGDTAWEIARLFTREEVDTYLENRRSKRFNVIQAVVVGDDLARLSGGASDSGLADAEAKKAPNGVNIYGRRPFIDADLTRPDVTPGNTPGDARQYDYWDHLDYIVKRAERQGLYIALAPVWGNRLADARTGAFTLESAKSFGRFLGQRYRGSPNIIWMLGGDRMPVHEGVDYAPLWRAMATGIEDGAGGSPVISFHPSYGRSSALWFQGDAWLTFNSVHTGHEARDLPVWDAIAADFNRVPAKPVLVSQSNYEDHPVAWNPNQGYFRDADVRRQAYWSVFAGAAGYTYGHHAVWQQHKADRVGVDGPDRTWTAGLDRPGSIQMTHLINLIESRPMLARVPDQRMIVGENPPGARHLQATRDRDGAYAMVYVPTPNQTFTLLLSDITGGEARAWWYDVRTGAAQAAGQVSTARTQQFTSPATGEDWVLVLDSSSRTFPPPGKPADRP